MRVLIVSQVVQDNHLKIIILAQFGGIESVWNPIRSFSKLEHSSPGVDEAACDHGLLKSRDTVLLLLVVGIFQQEF